MRAPVEDVRQLRLPLLWFASAVFFQLLGSILHGAPLDPDSSIPNVELWGAFFVFLSWAVSTAVWGNVWTVALGFERHRTVGIIAFGSLGASLSAWGLASLQWIGPTHRPSLLGLCYAGHLLNCLVPRASAGKANAGRFGVTPFALILSILTVLCLLRAFVPQEASDPLRYNLGGPKLWSDHGGFYFVPKLPLAMLASFWEMLFVWGFSFLTGPGAKGLVEGQLFSQWATVAFGFTGVAVGLFDLLERFVTSRLWRTVAAAAALWATPFPLPWIAKNDWGVAGWTLCAASLLFSGQASGRIQLVATGLLLGAAFGGKPTTVFTIASLLLFWFFAVDRRGIQMRFASLLWIGSGFLIPFGLFTTRNWYYTRNPFFPAFPELFPSEWVSGYLKYHQAAYEARGLNLDPGQWLPKFESLWRRFPLIALLLVPPGRRRWVLWGIGLLAFALYGLKVKEGLGDALRLAGPALFLLAASSILALDDLSRWLERSAGKLPRYAFAAIVCAFAIVPPAAHFPWSAVADAFHLPPANECIRSTHLGGDAKAWLRMHADPRDVIVSTGDDQFYYVSHLDIHAVEMDPGLDREVLVENDLGKALEALKRRRVRYVLDTLHPYQGFWSPFARRLDAVIAKNPAAVAFQGPQSRVIDFDKLPWVPVLRDERLRGQGGG